MGQPVVHFEIIGRDPQKLQDYYAGMFGWEISQPGEPVGMNYGIVQREGNTNADGAGIGGGVGGGTAGYDGHVTFYVEVPSVEEGRPRASAASA
jgi:uncharacterized protein